MIITAILGVYTLVTRQLRVCAMQAGFKEISAQYKKHKARLKAQQAERRACSGPSISEAEQVNSHIGVHLPSRTPTLLCWHAHINAGLA